MNTNTISIEVVDSPAEATNYNHGPVKYTGLSIEKCVIVGKGTVEGNPTVDLVLTNDKGEKFVTMTTGAILDAIAKAVEGKRLRDNGHG